MPAVVPDVAFLGLVERFQQVRDWGTQFLKVNLLGLKSAFISPIFPLPLVGPALAFAFYNPVENRPGSVCIRDDAGVQVGSVNFQLSEFVPTKPGPPSTEELVEGGPSPLVWVSRGWTFVPIATGQAMLMMIQRPGVCGVFLQEGEQETLIGQLVFILAEPEPLTEARKAAIRSHPSAAKAIRAEIVCNLCHGAIKAYAGLERIADLEEGGFIWYENLPDTYKCSCGSNQVDLRIWKRNLHGLLGMANVSGELVPLYEKGALNSIYANFAALIQEKAREEVFQKFIEENPVLLHQFSPEKLFFKAPILSLRKTGFAIVNHEHELILIELEKPYTQLLKEDGNIHHELQHAIGQAREWLHHADEHRLAVLQCIGAEQKEVGAVRAVVVAGRDAGYNPDHLRRLKGDPSYGRIRIMTYDDLLANFGTLVRGIEAL
jgi:hypothetical protein